VQIGQPGVQRLLIQIAHLGLGNVSPDVPLQIQQRGLAPFQGFGKALSLALLQEVGRNLSFDSISRQNGV